MKTITHHTRPDAVTTAARALVEMYLVDELRHYLGCDPGERRTHIARRWVALARVAAPDTLRELSGEPELHALINAD